MQKQIGSKLALGQSNYYPSRHNSTIFKAKLGIGGQRLSGYWLGPRGGRTLFGREMNSRINDKKELPKV